MSQIENWKEIKDYPRYEISSLGRIRNKNNFYFNLKPHKTKGYVEVSIGNASGKKSIAIHRLVGESFITNTDRSKYDCINHKNGIKTDNRVENLEWCSKSENMLHAYRTGLIKPTYGAAKLTIEDVMDIKKLIKMGMDHSKIALLFGISSNQVRSVRKRTWGTLKKIYSLSRLS